MNYIIWGTFLDSPLKSLEDVNPHCLSELDKSCREGRSNRATRRVVETRQCVSQQRLMRTICRWRMAVSGLASTVSFFCSWRERTMHAFALANPRNGTIRHIRSAGSDKSESSESAPCIFNEATSNFLNAIIHLWNARAAVSSCEDCCKRGPSRGTLKMSKGKFQGCSVSRL